MKKLCYVLLSMSFCLYVLFSDQKAYADLSYKVLDTELTGFIQDFNQNKDTVKLVFIVGPSCGVCLRGLADLNEAFFEGYADHPKLEIFVLHVPTLRAQEKHVKSALPLMNGKNVMHYWDPTGQTGLAFQKALEIPRYAWDVWMLYTPNTQFKTAEELSSPAFWQHQLGKLEGYEKQRLNAKEFANEVSRYIN